MPRIKDGAAGALGAAAADGAAPAVGPAGFSVGCRPQAAKASVVRSAKGNRRCVVMGSPLSFRRRKLPSWHRQPDTILQWCRRLEARKYEDDDASRATESTKRALVELGPDLRAGLPEQ